MQILPNAKSQFIDSAGQPLSSGSVGFYFPGTLNPKATFQDMAGTIANPNPVLLDSRGQALIWGSGIYRQILKDASGVTIWDQITEDPNGGLTGNMTDAKFASGADFTPGITTQLTLPAGPGSVTNMWVFFDGTFQADDQYTINGTTLTFNAPIPVGVQEVNVKIGSTIAIGTPGPGTVNMASLAPGSVPYNRAKTWADPVDFGADPNGFIDSTVAINAALTANPDVRFGIAGTYLCGLLTLPATLKNLEAANGVIIKPSSSVPTASAANWLTGTSNDGARIHGFTFQAPSVTYPSLTCLLMVLPNACHVHDNTFNGSGSAAISMAVGTNCKVYNNQVTDWLGNGIVVSGSSSSVVDLGSEIYGNFVQGNGAASVAQGISIAFALDYDCHDNRSISAGNFGISAFKCQGGKIHDNQCLNSIAEGINTEDSSLTRIYGNTLRWDTGGGPSLDFGMSIFGNTTNCSFIDVFDNLVINSGSTGICFTGSLAGFGVQNSKCHGNFVINCNSKRAAVHGGTDNLAAILYSGSATQANVCKDNIIFDNIGTLTYGIAELSFGIGLPSSQEITNNRVSSTVGFISAPILRSNTFTTLMGNTPDLAGLQPYVPIVQSSAGAITSYTSAGGYVQVGRTIFWYATATITNNGTGSGALLVTAPFLATSSASLGGGMCCGNNVTAGKALSGNIPASGTSAVIGNFDGTYPVATGNTITLFGIEMLA